MFNAIGNYIGKISSETAAMLTSAFVSRVETDGGVVESQSCLTSRIQDLKTKGLWSKASAVWLPHGYKEGKLYAVKGGAGADLGITRAGTRTRKGPTYVEQVPYNLLRYSNDFSNAIWSKGSVTVNSGAVTGPYGISTATKLVETASNSEHYVLQTITQTTTSALDYRTYTVWLKGGERTIARVRVDNSAATRVYQANIDLSTGSILERSASGGGYLNETLTVVGNGWYKFTVSVTLPNTVTDRFIVYGLTSNVTTSIFTGNASYLGDGTSGFYIYNPQIVEGESEREEFTTTDHFNVPALDYTNDTCPALSLEPARTNLLLQSETFGTTWVPTRTTVSSNAITAPDGLTTADAILETATAGTHAIGLGMTKAASAIQYALSFYVKPNGRDWVGLQLVNAGVSITKWFNVTTGTIGSTVSAGGGYTFQNAEIKDMGNGWYRCIMIATTDATTATNGYIFLGTGDNVSSYSGDITKGIYLAGAQLEQGAYATSYIPTTTGSVMRIADAVNELYPEKTNLFFNSEAFTGWNNGAAVVTSNVTTAPDGTLTADKVAATTTNGGHFVWQVSGAAGANNRTITVSVCAKKAELNYLQITANATGTPFANYNLDAGEVGLSSGATGTIEPHPAGNGWYICTWTATVLAFANLQFRVVNGDISVGSWVGDNVSGIYLWGAQLEWGNQRTTYLPTTSTYVHDGSVIGQTEGTLYFEGSSFADSTAKMAFSVDDGTITNRIGINISPTNQLEGFVVRSSVVQADILTSANFLTTGTLYKIAVTYQANKCALFVNGVKIGEDLTVTVPQCHSIRIGSYVGGTNTFYGEGDNWTIINTAISDAEAIALTTP